MTATVYFHEVTVVVQGEPGRRIEAHIKPHVHGNGKYVVDFTFPHSIAHTIKIFDLTGDYDHLVSEVENWANKFLSKFSEMCDGCDAIAALKSELDDAPREIT